ncbi:hypothetical protein PGT21_017281 [Puccinia graminis f. sp. tritici]|nr:hypothetical protein PGT21_017281 [Puccinia graminis f. sp. tritici]
MIACRFVFLAAISLLTSTMSKPIDGDSGGIDCFRRLPVSKVDCQRAISKIHYQHDNTLDTASKHFGWASGNCSIIVLNPDGAATNKAQIEDGFKQILDKCNPHAGEGPLKVNEGVFLHIAHRSNASYAAYESDHPFLKPTCGMNMNAPDTQSEDCKKAYKDIPLNGQGQFLSPAKQKTSSVTSTYKSCNVTIYTSDDSALLATKGNLDNTFEQMLGQCKGKSGVVSIKEGAQGLNGRVLLDIKSSVPCGFGPGKQVCH